MSAELSAEAQYPANALGELGASIDALGATLREQRALFPMDDAANYDPPDTKIVSYMYSLRRDLLHLAFAAAVAIPHRSSLPLSEAETEAISSDQASPTLPIPCMAMQCAYFESTIAKYQPLSAIGYPSFTFMLPLPEVGVARARLSWMKRQNHYMLVLGSYRPGGSRTHMTYERAATIYVRGSCPMHISFGDGLFYSVLAIEKKHRVLPRGHPDLSMDAVHSEMMRVIDKHLVIPFQIALHDLTQRSASDP